MLQGVTNAPSTFQRLIEHCMGDINFKEVLVFIDDLVVFYATLEEHEKRLLLVLQHLKDYGLASSLLRAQCVCKWSCHRKYVHFSRHR